MRILKESVDFWGHKNIRGNHLTTLEITKETDLSVKGDCIIGISCNKAGVDFSDKFKEMLRNNETFVKIEIIINNQTFNINARGHKNIILSHPKDLVIRKSSFICSRTLVINADKAAIDIPRRIIRELEKPETKGIMHIIIFR